jgi:acetate kinase
MLATNVTAITHKRSRQKHKPKILVCNAGSSSLKFSLFDAEDEVLLADGGVDWLAKPARLVFAEQTSRRSARS